MPSRDTFLQDQDHIILGLTQSFNVTSFQITTVLLLLLPFNLLPFLTHLQRAIEKGAKSVKAPWEESDSNGTVRFAMVQTYGDTTHTFVDRTKYNGWFLPGFQKTKYEDPLNKIL